MKKLLVLLGAAAVPVVAGLLTIPGCTDACEELAEQCDYCPNVTYRKTCWEVANQGVKDVCSGELSTFQLFCYETDAGTADGDTSCMPGQTRCGEQCVTLAADPAHCGQCGQACSDGQVCSLGSCADSCQEPLEACDGSCVNGASDPNHCGACNNVCPSQTPMCQAGECVAECSDPYPTACNNGCVNLASDPLNCGECGNACEAGKVCSGGSCQDSCADGLILCCGQCVDTQSDPAHCGGCDPNLCPSSEVDAGTGGGGGGGAGGAGAGGGGGGTSGGGDCSAQGKVCLRGECADDCGTLTNCGGACIDLGANKFNCGACGTSCAATEVCASGECAGSCAANETECNGGCVDLLSNPAACGACGTVCTPPQMCNMGLCADDCGSGGLLECPAGSGACIDVGTDPENCGSCGNDCAAQGLLCSSGQCVNSCGAGETNCNGSCVDLTSDMNNCGGCGLSCHDNDVCTADSCGDDGCVNQSIVGTLCDDGNACNVDSCDSQSGCQHRALTPSEVEGICGSSSPDQCVYCLPDGGCASGPRSDGIACSEDYCELHGTSHIPDSGACPTGCGCDLDAVIPGCYDAGVFCP